MNDARARPTLEAAISSNCGAITVARQLEFSVCLSYGYAHGRETAHHRGRSSTKRKPNNGRRIIATRDSLLFVRRRMASRNSRVIHKEEGRKEEREGDAQKREEIRGLEEASEENTGKNRPSSPALYYRPGNTPNGHRLTLK